MAVVRALGGCGKEGKEAGREGGQRQGRGWGHRAGEAAWVNLCVFPGTSHE